MAAAIFIPARLSSSRLPRKLLAPIGGTPALGYLIDRVRRAGIDRVVLCTTTDAADDELAALAEARGVSCFRGDPEDIIVRFDDAARTFGVDVIVNVDGDDIFCDSHLVRRTAEILAQGDADFVRWTGLPLGAVPVGFTARALGVVRAGKVTTQTATGWGRFFLDRALFRVADMHVDVDGGFPPDLRLTLDYPEDYALLDAIEGELRASHGQFTIDDIIQVVRRKPELLAGVRGLNDAYWKRFEQAAVDPTVRRMTGEG